MTDVTTAHRSPPCAATVRVDRLTGPDAEARAEPLLREYLRWVTRRLDADLGLRFDDVDMVVEHHHQAFCEEMPNLTGPRGRLLLATLGGRPAGVCALKPVDAATAEVKRMYVRPRARGCGVGRALLDRLVADARAEGYRLLRLETVSFMHEAHALYRSVGFVDAPVFETPELALSGLEDLDLCMQLDLTG